MATRLVPFLSWVEWERVCQNLFAQGCAENQQGLNRVAVWRYRGRVPVAVETTAELVEIRLRDPTLGCLPPVALPEHSLRCLYAMSIVRFVNGITDQSQKGRAAIPVATLAEAAGLPRVLVDIRHEAVHNELPSLPLLRMAARQALSWLEANYWTAQKQALLLSRAITFHNLVQLAVLQGPPATESEPTPSRKRKKSGGEEKASKKKQKTKEESSEKERARLVRELTDVEPENLVDALLELCLSCGGREPLRGPDPEHVPDGGVRKAADGQMGKDVPKDGWKGAVEALAGKAPYLPSMLLSEAIRRLAVQDGYYGAGDIAGNVDVAGNEPFDVNGGLDRRAELNMIAFWLLSAVETNDGSEGGRMLGMSTPLLKELLRRCLVFRGSPLGAELVRALMTSLAEVKTAHVAGSHESSVEASLPEKMQALLKLAAVTGNAPDSSRDETREGADVVEFHDFEKAAQMQSQLLQALPRIRAGASAATGNLEAPGRQSDETFAREASLEGPWSLAEDWAPCALGTIPSPLHPLGRVAELSRLPVYPDVLATRMERERNDPAVQPATGDYLGTEAPLGLPTAELLLAEIGEIGPSTRINGCERTTISRGNMSAGVGTSAEIDTAEASGRPMDAKEAVDSGVTGAGTVYWNGVYVAISRNSSLSGDVHEEQLGTAHEKMVWKTEERESEGYEKEGSGLMVDGLCLQGTVQKLSSEEQAHIREAIAIL